jgi:hypothetical protein
MTAPKTGDLACFYSQESILYDELLVSGMVIQFSRNPMTGHNSKEATELRLKKQLFP